MSRPIYFISTISFLSFMLLGCGGDTASQIQKLEDQNKKFENQLLEAREKLIKLEKGNSQNPSTSGDANLQAKVARLERELTQQRNQIAELNKRLVQMQRVNQNRNNALQKPTTSTTVPNPQLNKNTTLEQHRKFLVSMIGGLVNNRKPLSDITSILNGRNIRTESGGVWDNSKVVDFIRRNKIQRTRPQTTTNK